MIVIFIITITLYLMLNIAYVCDLFGDILEDAESIKYYNNPNSTHSEDDKKYASNVVKTFKKRIVHNTLRIGLMLIASTILVYLLIHLINQL